MTKEEYREHLCSVIILVFNAENAIISRATELKSKLRNRTVTPDQYVHMIADEIPNGTPEEELERILNE